MSLFSWLASRQSQARTRRSRQRGPASIQLRLEQLEDRLTPSVSFDPSSGILVIQTNSQNSNDSVSITAAGANSDGSTGVTVTSNITNNQPTTYGSSTAPVTQILLDLKDGNDTVQIADLPAVKFAIGEGNGNDTILIGKNAGADIIAGSGVYNIRVGDGPAGPTTGGRNLFVTIGYTYTALPAFGAITFGQQIGNNNSNSIELDNQASNRNEVFIAGDGNNQIIMGNGFDDEVFIYGNGSNSVSVGDGGSAFVQITGNGNNSVSVGNGDFDSVTVSGSGNNSVTAGNGFDPIIQITGDGNNFASVGNGQSGSISVSGNGNNTIHGGPNFSNVVYLTGSGHNYIAVGSETFVEVNGVFPVTTGFYGDTFVQFG